MKKWIVWLGVFLCARMAQAEIFKWTDEEGGIHFSDRPPNQESKEPVVDFESFDDPPIHKSGRPKTREELIDAFKRKRHCDICDTPYKKRLTLYQADKIKILTKIRQLSVEILDIREQIRIIGEYDNSNRLERDSWERARDLRSQLYPLNRERTQLRSDLDYLHNKYKLGRGEGVLKWGP